MVIDKRVNWVVETDKVHEVQVNGQPAAGMPNPVNGIAEPIGH